MGNAGASPEAEADAGRRRPLPHLICPRTMHPSWGAGVTLLRRTQLVYLGGRGRASTSKAIPGATSGRRLTMGLAQDLAGTSVRIGPWDSLLALRVMQGHV